MGSYNYKYAQSQLPPYLTDEVEGYEGGVAASYYNDLEKELAVQYACSKTMHDKKLLHWLKTRPKTAYNAGPAIVDVNITF